MTNTLVIFFNSVTRQFFRYRVPTEVLRYVAALAVILMHLKIFYWLRFFNKTAFLVRLVVRTINDIRPFMVLFFICVLMFSNAMLVLNQNRADAGEDSLFESATNISAIDSAINSFLLGVGEFDLDALQAGSAPTDTFIAYGLFLTAIFVT
jgi:hypothetical protein